MARRRRVDRAPRHMESLEDHIELARPLGGHHVEALLQRARGRSAAAAAAAAAAHALLFAERAAIIVSRRRQHGWRLTDNYGSGSGQWLAPEMDPCGSVQPLAQRRAADRQWRARADGSADIVRRLTRGRTLAAPAVAHVRKTAGSGRAARASFAAIGAAEPARAVAKLLLETHAMRVSLAIGRGRERR